MGYKFHPHLFIIQGGIKVTYNTITEVKTYFKKAGHTEYDTPFTDILNEANQMVDMKLKEVLSPDGADLSISSPYYYIAKGAEMQIACALIDIRFPNLGTSDIDNAQKSIEAALKTLEAVAVRPAGSSTRRSGRIAMESAWNETIY